MFLGYYDDQKEPFEKAFCGAEVDEETAREVLTTLAQDAIELWKQMSLARQLLHIEDMAEDAEPFFQERRLKDFKLLTTVALRIEEASECSYHLLEEKLMDLLEGTTVREENIFIRLVNEACGNFAGTYDDLSKRPTFDRLDRRVLNLGVKSPRSLLVPCFLPSFRRSREVHLSLLPERNHFTTSFIGTMTPPSDDAPTLRVYTDSLRYDTLRFLAPLSSYVFGSPEAVGTLYLWPVKIFVGFVPFPRFVELHIEQRMCMEVNSTGDNIAFFDLEHDVF